MLEASQRTLGNEHPDTLSAMNNLANLPSKNLKKLDLLNGEPRLVLETVALEKHLRCLWSCCSIVRSIRSSMMEVMNLQSLWLWVSI